MRKEQGAHKLPRKVRIYNLAKNAWTILSWVWTALIIALLVQIVPQYLFTENVPAWNALISWLKNADLPFPGNALRLLALFVAIVLVSITPLALMFKYALRNVQPEEGFSQLIDVLQQDSISPQLRLLRKQFGQLIQKQDICIKELTRIGDILLHVPTSSNIQQVLSSLQQQQSSLRQAIVRPLNDVETRAAEQVQWLGDLYEQERYTQESLLAGLEKLSCLLEQVRDRLPPITLSDQEESSPPSESVQDEDPSTSGELPIPKIADLTNSESQEHIVSEQATSSNLIL